jgi:beta-glucosidase
MIFAGPRTERIFMFDPDTVLSQLTLAEKASLVTGATLYRTADVARLGVPAIVLMDGPHGVRKASEDIGARDLYKSAPATAFPTASATGCSWDPELLEEIGTALAAECRELGVDVLLGPGVNIKRSPLCGRNFEYFAEDPVLAGELAAAWIRGLQRGGIGASLKHFAANNQETRRMQVSAETDERTLREIYLPAFERAVKASRPATVMCSYNWINGVRAAEHEWLLTRILRDEWGFDGLVVSDWGAVVDLAVSIRAGLDLEMPSTSGRTARLLAEAVTTGALEEKLLDRAVERILHVIARLLNARAPQSSTVDHARHHALARRAAAESAVLLTNRDRFLPLDPASHGTLAVIGEFARTPVFQGGGSSHVQPTQVDTALDEIRKTVTGQRELVFAPGFTLDGTPNPALLDEAVAIAQQATDVVVFLGLPQGTESEGFDRATIDLPAVQVELLRSVAAVNPRVAVVLSNGGVVATAPVERYAPAVLEMWLGGQAAGGATADLLFGQAEPGGRLAETIPVKLSDNPAHVNFPGTADRVHYGERIYVGYRWYDKTERTVAHPFGHGLSYTTFAYADLHVAVPDPASPDSAVPDSAVPDSARPRAELTFTVTNTGQRPGTEVAQVYVTDVEASADRPERELKAFRKLRLAPGESQATTLTLTERDFAFWDEQRGAWTVEPGTFRIAVGASSRDIRLTADIDLAVPLADVPLTAESSLREWLGRPVAREVLGQALGSSGGPGPLGLSEEIMALAGGMPIRRVLRRSLPDITDEDIAILVARANEAS